MEVGYESFLAPEMYFHPVSQAGIFCYARFRNFSTKIFRSPSTRQSTTQSTHAPSSTVFDCTKTSCYLEAQRFSRALTSVCKRCCKSAWTPSPRSRTQSWRTALKRPKSSARFPKILCSGTPSGSAVPCWVRKITSPKFARRESSTKSMGPRFADTTRSSKCERCRAEPAN